MASVRRGRDGPGMVWFGTDRNGSHGLSWSGRARRVLVRRGLIWSGKARQLRRGAAEHGLDGRCRVRRGRARQLRRGAFGHGAVGNESVWPDTVWSGQVGHGLAASERIGLARNGQVGLGVVRRGSRGEVRHGQARLGLVRRGSRGLPR